MVDGKLRPLCPSIQPPWRRLPQAAVCALLLAAGESAAFAQTSNVFHWPRTQTEISPPVIDSLPPEMSSDLNYVVAAWNQSSVVQSAVQRRNAPGNSCGPILGAIRFCIATDNNPFFASNQLFYVGDGHLIAVRAVIHDYFIDAPPFTTSTGRRAIFCYLLGVGYGVTPQDFDPTNPDIIDASGQQSCLDASFTPEGNENPTPVDFAALATLYEHSHTDFGMRDFSGTDRIPTLPSVADLAGNLGAVTKVDQAGRPAEFTRQFANGVRVVTKVLVEH